MSEVKSGGEATQHPNFGLLADLNRYLSMAEVRAALVHGCNRMLDIVAQQAALPTRGYVSLGHGQFSTQLIRFGYIGSDIVPEISTTYDTETEEPGFLLNAQGNWGAPSAQVSYHFAEEFDAEWVRDPLGGLRGMVKGPAEALIAAMVEDLIYAVNDPKWFLGRWEEVEAG